MCQVNLWKVLLRATLGLDAQHTSSATVQVLVQVLSLPESDCCSVRTGNDNNLVALRWAWPPAY